MSESRPLDVARLDRDGALAESADRIGITRGALLATAFTATVGLAAAPAYGKAGDLGAGDEAILNYALVLEYLQSSFYTEAERLGALKGERARAAEVLGAVERAHVRAFRAQLGSRAVKRPAFDFQGTTESPDAFLKTAVAFEDLAVAAYAGQAPRLHSDAALAAALSIHSVEARHAAWMRYLVGAVPARAAFDEPRSKGEVARLVRTTNFVADTPSTTGRRLPRFTG
jgi:hypothetical protein